MIGKEDYHKIKKYIKNLSRPQIKQLCSDMELNTIETNLLLSSYDGDMIVKVCLDNYISETTYTKYIKKVYSKVYNYFLYINITF
jgi:hypothetical protein